MAINTDKYQNAYAKFRTDLKAAVTKHDGDLTATANTKRRHEAVMAARGALIPSIPAEAKVTRSRVDFLAGLTPKTADAVAVAQYEFGIVERLLGAGHPIEAVIRDASPARLQAISAYVETLPSVLGATEPAVVAAELRERVFEALADGGDATASIIRAEEQDVATQNAWRGFLVESLEGTGTIGGRTDLFAADPEGYKQVLATEAAQGTDVDVNDRVAKLDRVFGIGQPQSTGV